MANLETLELTVNGSAKSASEGIDKLIHSLSALSDAITKPFSDLVDFNAELKKMKELCGAINLPNIAKATGASKAVAKAKAKASDYDPATNNNKTYIPPAQTAESMQKDAEWYAKFRANATADYEQRKAYHDWATQRRQAQADAIQQEARAKEELAKVTRQAYSEAIQAEKEAMNVRGEDTRAIMEQSTKLDLLILKQEALRMETISLAKEGKLTAKQIADRSMQYQKLGGEIEKLQAQMNQTKEATKGLEEQTKESSKGMSKSIKDVQKSSGGLLSTIGRIFKTMLIRTAIRALLKAAKEGLDNYYQYSKQMGNAFGTSMDKINSKWTQIKNQIGAGLGTALSSLLPILNVVAKAVLFVLNIFTALFALLSGQTTYTQAVEGMEDYKEAVTGAGKAASQWLATFDELNVMSQDTGGGGGSGGVGFGDMFKEVELPQWMVEWKPLIEAILGGVLGAIILPKIWDWVKKIFGLFSGGVADKAMDFVKKVLDKDSKLPSLSSQATDMVVFGGGAAAAAAALPVVYEYIDKIVKALDGVSLVGSLLGLIGELLKKAFEAIPVPLKLDTKEYDEFKEKHEEWIKNVDKKTVEVIVDDDIAKITKLTLWAATEDTKTIKVEIDNDAAGISKLMMWVGTEETKIVNVKLVENEFAMVMFGRWVESKPNKYVNIILLDQVNGINRVQEWIDASATKYIDIEFRMNTPSGGGGNSDDDSAWDQTWNRPIWEITDDAWDQIWHTPIWELFGKRKKPVEVPASDVVTIVDFYNLALDARKEFTDSLKQGFTTRIAELKDAIPGIKASDIIRMTDWSTFSFNQKIEFLNAIKTAFGAEEAKKAAKAAGINIADLVSHGMQSSDPKIRKMAEEWAEIIKTGTESKPPVITPTLNQQVTKDIADNIKKTIEGVNPTVKVNKINVPDNEKNGAKDSIEKGVKPTVVVNVKPGSFEEFKKAFIAALSVKLNLSNKGVDYFLGQLTAKASGGFVDSGDIFIANENNVPEMIGRFGNQTAVANTDQIVAGIASGVSAANQEQNALLRQQNALLTEILQKDNTVRLTASSALGRTVNQSLKMYGAMVGV